MAEKGIDISNPTPSAWTDEMLGSADVIVTMVCGDSCPFIPGRRYLDGDWPTRAASQSKRYARSGIRSSDGFEG
jgi:protein-tyrosine-phosphatase